MSVTAEADRVNEALAIPNTGWIKDVDINLFHSTIMFSVTVTSEHKRHTIVFSEVASFYYSRSYGDFRFEDTGHEFGPGFWAISEWTSADFYPKGVGTVSIHAEPGSHESQWVGRYGTNPNFAIEQLGGMFFIEAGRVQVDDQVFEVGYPPARTNEPEEGGS